MQGVERRRRAANLLPAHGNLAVGAEGHTLGDGGVRAAGNFFLVVGERRVDVRAVGVKGARAVAIGVVFGCLGAGRWLYCALWVQSSSGSMVRAIAFAVECINLENFAGPKALKTIASSSFNSMTIV